ncbi:hypothetical protein F4678DRAFT_64958 [Xylaria arbuscula]|nr:hypothetical protein F4678DRAFT_64958 [Xylaria arbuscula]
MRLLTLQDDGKLILTKDLASNIPPYAILSHTWGSDDEEVTYEDITQGTGNHKDGFRKIQFCATQAISHGLQYFWVDSCCIDKSNSTELSQAINSMFRWYRDAARCYAYLSDVLTGGCQNDNSFQWESAFRERIWFKRGWTLQELIAPFSVEFFSVEGQRLGDKKSLERQLHEITGIATPALRGSPLSDFSRRERMLWADGRTTKLDEDRAYSLLGIFEVHLPLIYGEGVRHALRRLEEEIDKQEMFERRQPRNGHLMNLEPLPMTPVGFRDAEEYYRSLWFPSMNTRRLNLEKPAEQTCLWLFEHVAYQDWFLGRNQDKYAGLLWLKGKPGSGKSVLMKEAVRQAMLGQDKSDYWAAAFFFNANGGELEKSPLGLFRSLLHQLLPKDSEHFQRFRKLWDERNSEFYENGSKSCPWQETELRSFFHSMFSHQRAKRTIIFIDALDECDSKSMRSQASFWQEVTWSAYNAKVELSVCISIRDFPSITVPDCYEILIQSYNHDDIATYLHKRFTLSIADKEPHWKRLKNKVLQKSAGVFLWVVLVVDDLLGQWDNGKNVQSLLKQLDVVPEKLQSLFSTMFNPIDPSMRDLTIRVFQWAVLAPKPLRLHEWHHIMAFVRHPVFSSLHDWRESDNFTQNDDQLEKQIRSISKGLIEVSTTKNEVQDESLETLSVCAGAGSLNVEYGETRIVQVIHESVREFFLQNNGFLAVYPNLEPEPVGYGHCSIMATCLDYINIRELDALVQARNLVEQREKDGSIEDLSEPESHKPRPVSVQAASGFSGCPKDTDNGSGVSLDVGYGAKRNSHAKAQGRIKPASIFELLQSSESSHIDMNRWLETLPTDKCFAEPVIPISETTCHFSTSPSVTGQSQMLEDYPALLSYATSEFFTHARLAEEKGADPSSIINSLVLESIWARWVALREDVPRGVELRDYAADQGLSSWTSIIPQSVCPHQDISQELEPGPWVIASEDTQLIPSKPRRRKPSVASFSSAGSHRGDMGVSKSSQPRAPDSESLKEKMRQKGEEEARRRVEEI